MTLLPCQVQTADEFVRRGGRMFLDASVGAGKTYAAGECIRRSISKYPVPALYLTPAYAIKSQVAKLRECGLDAQGVEGTADKRLLLWKSPVCVVSFECLVRDFLVSRAIPWGIIVVDEADQLTAGASKRNKCLLRLTPRHRLMMTGTPLKNGLKDAFMPLSWLPQVPLYRNWTDFSNRELLYGNPLVPNQITGIRDKDRLATLMASYTYKMTNPDAPASLEVEVIRFDLSPEQRAEYDQLVKDSILETQNGTLICSNKAVLHGRLRQYVAMPSVLFSKINSTKEQQLLSLLNTIKGNVLIFTSFSTVARTLAGKYTWPIIDGKVSKKERTRLLASEPPILVATAAAERSVDAPYVDVVISLDRGHTDAVLTQRGGRANRYGRSGKVRHILLCANDTVDDKGEERIVLRKLKEARKVHEKICRLNNGSSTR